MDKLRVLPFGGCRINNPFSQAEASDSRLLSLNAPWIPAVYTFNEVAQIIDIWNGDVRLPQDIAPFLSPWSDRLTEHPGQVSSADVVLVETSSETELFLDGFSVNRAAISDQVLKPIKTVSKDAHRHMSKWYNNGLVGFDEDLRAAHSAELLKHIPDDLPNAEILRRIVRDLRSTRANPREGFRKILSRISVPLGYVTHVWQFLPDGRLMNWPAGYHEGVDEARRELGIPAYNPEEFVLERGVTSAMREDFRHYTKETIAEIAKKLVDFAASLHDSMRTEVAVVR